MWIKVWLISNCVGFPGPGLEAVLTNHGAAAGMAWEPLATPL